MLCEYYSKKYHLKNHPQIVAYLTGHYPAVSHTFILREITALRELGVKVITCSVNRPHPAQVIGPEEKEAAASTFYLLSAASNPIKMLISVMRAARKPSRLLTVMQAVRRSGASSPKNFIWQFLYVMEALVLARHLEQQGVTRIHNQLGMSSASVSLYASILLDLPFSFTLHGPDDFHDGAFQQLRAKVAHADFVACISEFCRNKAMEASDPLHRHKLKIVRCGLDPSRYEIKHWRSPGRRILFVGRLVPVKGVSLLLEAFARIVEMYSDAQLVIVGDGPQRTYLEQTARALGVSRQMDFKGYLNQQEVAAQLKLADLFILPSYAEGLPVVLMEAMATGVPVIATHIAGIPELVQDKISGRVIAPGNVKELARVIKEHFADPNQAAKMVIKGKEIVIQNHDMWKEATKMRDLFASEDPHVGSARVNSTC